MSQEGTENLNRQGAGSARALAVPSIGGFLVLAVAYGGAVLTGEGSEAVGGANGLVESLSGRSSALLGNVGAVAPLGFAFAAGMVSTVNPCGFAMLPAYLGLYLGSHDAAAGARHVFRRLGRAMVVGGVVTAGLVAMFGIVGLLIGAGARSIVSIMPWVGLAVGVVLVAAGSWLLGGGKLYSGLAARASSRIGNPGEVTVRGYFLFGVSYGTASLSCTLPIFLTVVGATLATSGAVAAAAQFFLYGLGMGFVVMLLTAGISLFKGAMSGALRRALPFMQRASAALMLVAGGYIVFYWLTLGELL